MVSTNIRFFSEKIPFVVRQKKLLRDWIVSTIISEEKDLANLNVIFCDDKYLHEINFKYLTHDTFTDIVTFDFSENDLLSGDLYISIDRVRENASIYNKKVVDEVHRVIIHGILHLCGYSDKDKINKTKMSALEDRYLSLRPHGITVSG